MHAMTMILVLSRLLKPRIRLCKLKRYPWMTSISGRQENGAEDDH